MDKLRAVTSNNKSRRNYGNRVDGPWVFGIVLQNKSILNINSASKAQNKNTKKSFIRNFYPGDKKKRHDCYKDNRKINIKANRIYQFIQYQKQKSTNILLKKSRSYTLKNVQKKEMDIQEIRMFVVIKRDVITLMPIIMKNMAKYSDIHSDEWRAYNKIRKNGFKHYTVNHKENFVNPQTGKHTQLIECYGTKQRLKSTNEFGVDQNDYCMAI
jgi:hypothetical protein